ncbi:MAG: hypothetical protein EOP47_13195 [Sphingobacteriaceae bacterium]|nr:MAG: hypothetical protein EOP47_13195 [Sphingobacteriaceae bacterium]
MVKRIAYIVMLLMCISCLSFAGSVRVRYGYTFLYAKPIQVFQDSLSKKLKQQQEEEKKKIKEISKARRQAKPEKIDENGVVVPVPKSQRRPVGVERPPEIPRRNND